MTFSTNPPQKFVNRTAGGLRLSACHFVALQRVHSPGVLAWIHCSCSGGDVYSSSHAVVGYCLGFSAGFLAVAEGSCLEHSKPTRAAQLSFSNTGSIYILILIIVNFSIFFCPWYGKLENSLTSKKVQILNWNYPIMITDEIIQDLHKLIILKYLKHKIIRIREYDSTWNV